MVGAEAAALVRLAAFGADHVVRESPGSLLLLRAMKNMMIIALRMIVHSCGVPVSGGVCLYLASPSLACPGPHTGVLFLAEALVSAFLALTSFAPGELQHLR